MNTVELKNWLADRLRMRGPASADLDLRGDEAPYERPLKLWKTAEGNFHYEILRAVLALTEEAAAEPWEPESFDQLARLIEAGRMGEAVATLETLAHSRRLLTTERGAQLHMQVLRTLLALQWKGSLEFWMTQKAMVGDRWPGLVFKGLACHDLHIAFGELPSLATDAKATRQILDLFPGMMRAQKLTITNLQELSGAMIAYLPDDSANAIREWFAHRDVPRPATMYRVHMGLKAAIAEELGDAVIARTYEAALVGSAEPELAVA